VDLTLTADQAAMLEAVGTLLDRHAGPVRARELGEDGHDDVLLSALADAGFLDLWSDAGAGPLEAALVVEAVARALGRVNVGARALVAPAVLDGPAPGEVALAVAGTPAPVRFAAHAPVLLVLDGEVARVVEDAAPRARPVPGRFEYPFAHVDTDGGRSLGPGSGAVLRAWWQVSLAAEMAATSAAALEMTTAYLVERRQFGRPLASFQAVQHRLAEAHVSVQGALWLARRAAWAGARPEDATAAAGYAAQVARLVAAETQQLSGAIGLTLEYDLHLWTLRLHALRGELGGAADHFGRLAHARWPAEEGGSR
jgi:alkylation response protein AidB-like acyl-CoA dehydrogenase